MTPPNGMPTSAAADRQRGLLAELAEAARRILSAQERGTSGGLSRARVGGPLAVEIAVPLSAFKMVGLAEVQAKLADRWPAVAERVHQIARNTIAKHLVPGDVFEQHSDDDYLVLFATLGSAEAELKSRMIAKEICAHLLGEGEAQGVALQALSTQISAAALAAGDHEMVIADALTRVTAPPEPSVATRLGPWADVDDARSRLPPAPAGPIEGSGDRLPRAREADAAEETPVLRSHAYSPVWDVAQMTLLRFRAFVLDRPRADLADHTLEWRAFQADLGLIRAVGEDLRGLADHGRRLPITLALRHASLGSGSQRERLHQALAELPPSLRKMITLELYLNGDEFWTYACRAFLEMTNSLGVGISALVDVERPEAIPRGAARLRGVGVALFDEARGEGDSIALLSAFGRRARALDLECAAYGLTSRPLVLGAVGAGFRYLAGRAIHVDVPGLANAVRFEPLDLYADLIRRDATR